MTVKFKFKLIKINKIEISFFVPLAIFHPTANSHMWIGVTVLDCTDIESARCHGKNYGAIPEFL